MQQQMTQIPPSIPQRSVFKFSQPKQQEIIFNSCFDSGNMSKVNRNSYDHYSIWTAADAEGTPNQGYPKSWFHFQVGGFLNRKVSFSIHRVHFLWSVSKRSHLYRPVYQIHYQSSTTPWQRLPHPVQSLTMNQQEELVLKFDFYFTKDIKTVRFAFIYPYSYEDQRNDILRLKQLHQNKDQEVYFKQYQLIKSYEKRTLDLVIISSHQGKDGFQNIKFDEYFDLGEKLVKFRNNKPIIFVSARVHPIQTPSSFCMKGIIDFLLDKNDYRAFLLRKYFVFILIPMLNPDGVSNGHCRMDNLNQNLNRYYKNPDPVKQSPCYAVRKLCEHYQKDNRMFMYLDLHAHPATKGNFMFGNAIYDFIEQVESQVFPKILSQNCINFQFDNCIFSRRHMKAKDRYEDMNKEGCGRVVLYKDFGIPHAYTLQCGYHMNSYNNKVEPEKNTQNRYVVRYRLNSNGQKIYENLQRLYSISMLAKIEQTIIKRQPNTTLIMKKDSVTENIESQIDDLKTSTKSAQNPIQTKPGDLIKQRVDPKKPQKVSNLTKSKLPMPKPAQSSKTKHHQAYDGYDIFEFVKSPYDDNQNFYYKRELPIYDVGSYENLGRNILITVLDIFQKNPYSREIDLNQRRKEIAEKQSKLDRFRKQQAGIRNKMKNIVQLIEEQFYSPWIKRNVFAHADTLANEKAKRNKTLQFQIVKSSQNRMRNSTKQPSYAQTKRHLMLQSEVIKTSIGNENIAQIKSLNKIAHHNEDYQNRNTLLAKKIKSFKSKHKGPLKQFTSKQGIKQQITKKSIPLPTSQNIITLEQQMKSMKNEAVCLSNKVIKHPSYNMASLRMRNFMMQGNGALLSSYNMQTKHNQVHSLGPQVKR